MNLFSKKSLPRHLKLGRRGEKIALAEMRRRGLLILRTNYEIHGVGEIDVVARDGACLIFVEVKTRSSRQVRAGEAVDLQKRQKLLRTARRYLQRLENPQVRYRFDVAEVYITGRRQDVVYLPGAFDLTHT